MKVWIFKGEIMEHDPMAQDKRAAETGDSRPRSERGDRPERPRGDRPDRNDRPRRGRRGAPGADSDSAS